MPRRRFRPGAGRRGRLWLALAPLLAAVIVPTACVLWFMTRAIRNERLAVRQKLLDFYRPHLAELRRRVDRHWDGRLAELARAARGDSPGEVFAAVVRSGLCDGAVVYDQAGKVAYPSAATPGEASARADPPAWTRAAALEHEEGDLAAAAALYGEIARGSPDVNLAARAWQARARCLAAGGRVDEAIAIWTGVLAEAKFRGAVDPAGRVIAANADLAALQRMGGAADAAFDPTLKRLTGRLADYAPPVMPSAQRRFLMAQLSRLAGPSTLMTPPWTSRR